LRTRVAWHNQRDRKRGRERQERSAISRPCCHADIGAMRLLTVFGKHSLTGPADPAAIILQAGQDAQLIRYGGAAMALHVRLAGGAILGRARRQRQWQRKRKLSQRNGRSGNGGSSSKHDSEFMEHAWSSPTPAS
jgi:hypothetical protein